MTTCPILSTTSLGFIFLVLLSLYSALSDKDSELLHRINEGVTVNGKSLFQGDIVQDNVVNSLFSKRKKRGLARQPYRIWDDNTIPYVLDSNLGIRKLHALETAIRSWEGNTCIRFRKKRPSDTSYVLFTSGKGCFATIGKGEGEQLLSLGKGCGTPGFALHELAHVIGFFHEQSRPDRDDYVDIIWEHIREDKKEQFAKYTSIDIDPRGVPYDYLSITHYGPYDFRLNPGQETLKVKKLTENPADMGQRRYLSEYDVIGANVLYQCTQHLERQCAFGTRYVDTQVQEIKHYACKENGVDWSICSMPIMKNKKILVCNWNRTQYDTGKKIEPRDSWVHNGVDSESDPTATTDRCMQHVSYDKEIEIPCGEYMCKKVITEYRVEEGPCWGAMDDGFVTETESWSDWSPWSDCSRPCGRGMQLRFRMCTRDSDGTQSDGCPGYKRAVKMCCVEACYKDILVKKASGESETIEVATRQCPHSLRLESDASSSTLIDDSLIDLGDEEL